MCGIVGYVGDAKASEVVLNSLKKLEYRGYDSAGVAILREKIDIKKDVGKLDEIIEKHDFGSMNGKIGIGHTRWATHGIPNDINAHPHLDCKKEIVVVHNGIIENYISMKKELEKKGHKFLSETDTEVIAHLLEESKKETFIEKMREMLPKLQGSFAIIAMHKGENKLYCARRGSPLVLGVGKKEMFAASDIPAALEHTREFVFLHDDEVAVLSSDSYEIESLETGKKISRKPEKVEWTAEMARKDGYDYYMLKEINEQPKTLRQTLSTDVKHAVNMLKKYSTLQVIASGTSYHAGLVFKHLIQKHAKKRCEVTFGSEFPYSGIADKETLVIAISQSGETADTLLAVKQAKKQGAKILGITNVVGSTLSRESDGTVYLQSGPEISVVATKTFTSQLAALYKLVFSYMGMEEELEDLHSLSGTIEQLLSKSSEAEELAKKLKNEKDFLFIGRSLSYPVAMEGALKLKEITYLHAEAYAAGELKHGPLSLLEDGIPVIAIAPVDDSLPKTLGNIRECKARKGKIIAISDSEEALSESELSIWMPKVHPDLAPILYIIPLQLLAYHLAVMQKKDPDKPRNLAKSVTVE